ncbi:MAG: hypothetical protein ACTSO7_01755 [Candidatus Heimdallarchaeota archaeon]
MSADDDVFLKTFSQMIEVLTEINTKLESIKKSIDVVLPSIDGLGAGLTNINNQLSDLNTQINVLPNKIKDSIGSAKPVKEVIEKPSPKTKAKTKATKEDASKKEEVPVSTLVEVKHPIFIDLVKKVTKAESFKEVGNVLLEALEQIENTFSFSRAFYEIRREGNDLIRKGTSEFPANDKLEIQQKILDWENRLSK